MNKKIKQSIFLFCTISTLVYVTGFTVYNMAIVNTATKDGLFYKKESIVSCRPNKSTGTAPSRYLRKIEAEPGKGHRPRKENHPADKDRNLCSHYTIVGSLCETIAYKRRGFKKHNC